MKHYQQCLPKQIYVSPTHLMDVFRTGLLGCPLLSKATLFPPPPLYLPEGGLHHCICQNHVWSLSAAFYLYGLSFTKYSQIEKTPKNLKFKTENNDMSDIPK